MDRKLYLSILATIMIFLVLNLQNSSPSNHPKVVDFSSSEVSEATNKRSVDNNALDSFQNPPPMKHEHVAASKRVLPVQRSFQNLDWSSLTKMRRPQVRKTSLSCSKWAVTTTTTGPTEAVRRFQYKSDWCVVVIAEAGYPHLEEYKIPSGIGENVIFLSESDLQGMGSRIMDFILKMEAFNARRVAGYLFALANGARVIWDFEDDTMLNFWLDGSAQDPFLEINHCVDWLDSSPKLHQSAFTLEGALESRVINAFPMLGCPFQPCWPRGYPVGESGHCEFAISLNRTSGKNDIRILHSISKFSPDVDPYFSDIRGHFSFKDVSNDSLPIILPKGSYLPINSQSTLIAMDAIWTLYLPLTAPSEVADIWRGYIAQALLRVQGYRVGLLQRPLTTKQSFTGRSIQHDPTLIHDQTSSLSTILNNWVDFISPTLDNNPNVGMPHLLENIYFFIYEHGLLESQDLIGIQAWIHDMLTTPLGEHATYDYDLPLNASVGQNARIDLDGVPEQCNDLETNRLWLSDLHMGTRADLTSQLMNLDQHVFLTKLPGRGKDLNQALMLQSTSKGKVTFSHERSPVLRSTFERLGHVSEAQIQDMIDWYQDKESVWQMDAFVCAFPAALCEIWMPFNKSIVFIPAHRYNIGRCSFESSNTLNRRLTWLSKDSRHVIGAMSR